MQILKPNLSFWKYFLKRLNLLFKKNIFLTVGPTVNLVAAYLMAMAKQALEAPTAIEAIQIRPDRSWKKFNMFDN